ncbi:hypothetical protein ACSFA3_16670 [Variovorax sp. RHLX14]|uniref:hypothetical protein n=1 Tax=Variovorax sp. RHLX14 TaxID=1259731 RepID=UPI003F47BFC2
MKTVLTIIAAFFLTSNALAELTLQRGTSPRKAEEFIRSVSRSEFDSYVESHGAVEILKDGYVSKTGLTAVTSQTEYKWSFQNTEFFSYIKAFRTDLVAPPSCRENVQYSNAMDREECQSAISMFRQCHLFIVSLLRKLVAVQPLKIPQPDFIEAKPGCFDVYAMAPSKVVKDGMLIVVGYYDSRWTCNSGWYCASDSPAASPDPLYKTTFLVRFSEDAEGKLVLSQDDKCLPPLNPYDTIAKARHALKENGCH